MTLRKVLFFVFLLLGAYPINAMTEDEDALEPRSSRQLIKITSAKPQDYSNSQIVVKLPIPPDFKLSQIYPWHTQNGFVMLSTLTFTPESPVVYCCSGIDLYAIAVDGRTVEVHSGISKTTTTVTSLTHKVFVFSLKAPQFTFWRYSYSDGTHEVCPTIFAEECEVINLFPVPFPVTQIPQKILPYEITQEGFQFLPLMIRNRSGIKYLFTPVQGNPFLNQ